MKKIITALSTIAVLVAGIGGQAEAALAGKGPLNTAIGYPAWYEDTNGLRLDLCLDQNAMCLAVLPNPLLPPAVPGNFGPEPEAFYYMASAAISDVDPDTGAKLVDAQLTIALESGFVGAVAIGGQTVFARIRISINPRDAALANQVFTVTHPFGTTTLTTGDLNQNTTIGQDWPGLAAGDFTSALADAPLLAGAVNADGRSIGPFLVPTTPRVNVGGNVYLATPGALAAVTGGPLGNVFTIETGAYSKTQDLFDVQAKVSACVAGNLAPVAVDDPGAAAAAGAVTVINLIGNDTPGTVAINPASLTLTQPTNGTVGKNADGTVTYTPSPTFVGTDSFSYTVQDNCALTSNVITVPVVVERLAVVRADFRPKTGKWTVAGDSSAAAGSAITLRKGNATGPVIGTATVQANGSWKFVGKSKYPLVSPQNIHVGSAAGVTIAAPMKIR